ncbi:MAG: hypothetical protein FJ240_07940 [Nitrospira sp.]|nr:hypothetical protein [Nitrospira sp.]
MKEIADMAMKIFNAYEDYYLDRDKAKIFETLFDKYLTIVNEDGKTEPYDAIVWLAINHRPDFDEMVKVLKDHSLITD